SSLAHSSEEGPPFSGERRNLALTPRSLEPPPMHNLIIRFLRGARKLKPPRPNLIPSWDLAVVFQALQQDRFEPLQSVNIDALSLKMALLTALTSVKRVGDLQALSVNSSCLEFGPGDSHVVLRPWPGYVPKTRSLPCKLSLLRK
ncbi:hypothetical protein M9458_054629, partial [Cirrhinus mrigala]